jgi:hypothetical protein
MSRNYTDMSLSSQVNLKCTVKDTR